MPRRYVRRRNVFRRKRRTTRYPRPALKYRRKRIARIYHFKRTTATIPFVGQGDVRTLTQTANTQHHAAEFMLNQLPNYTEFTNLYDQYKITKIVCKLIPMLNGNGNVPVAYAQTDTVSSPSNPGLLISVLDYDDATPLSLIGDYLQYQNVRKQPAIMNRTHTRVIVPRVRKNVLQGGGGDMPAMIGKPGWIDCQYANIPHYGLKLFLDTHTGGAFAQTYQLMTTFYVKFKNVR